MFLWHSTYANEAPFFEAVYDVNLKLKFACVLSSFILSTAKSAELPMLAYNILFSYADFYRQVRSLIIFTSERLVRVRTEIHTVLR
jgi:hypothetical protein